MITFHNLRSDTQYMGNGHGLPFQEKDIASLFHGKIFWKNKPKYFSNNTINFIELDMISTAKRVLKESNLKVPWRCRTRKVDQQCPAKNLYIIQVKYFGKLVKNLLTKLPWKQL